MQQKRLFPGRHTPLATKLFLMAAFLALFAVLLAPTSAAPAGEAAAAAEWTVVADGLANPRHLTFGPDGALYVAEAGAGGDGVCFAGPEGNSCYGPSGAVTKVEFDAAMAPTGQARVITALPSLGAEDTGARATGPSATAFDGNDLYVLTGLGADPNFREPGAPLGSVGANFAQLMSTGPGDAFAPWVDIGDYEAAENPAADQIDTNPFDLERVADGYLVVDAGGNSLLHVTDAGVVSTLATFPAIMVEFPPGSGEMMPMDAVPTSVEVGPDGNYYVSQLTGFPFPPGAASVWVVPAGGGDPTQFAGGFTNILDLDFAADGSLYVLEMYANGMLSGNPTGTITRIAPGGARSVVAREGLITPTGLTVGPDQALYVSNFATSPTDGAVVRIPTRLSEAGDFAAFLSGDQENPPVETEASGAGDFELLPDGTLNYDIAVRDIDNINAAHIHEGAPGEAGPPIFTLFPMNGDSFDPDNPISGQVMLTDEQVQTLLSGNYYVNVHTTEFPNGEIRGQIVVSQTWAFEAMLSGANEVPHVHSDATGHAYVTVSADLSTLYYRVAVHDIQGVTASHIHEAPFGVNGPVVFPLFTGGPPPFDEDNPVAGMASPSTGQLAALLAGDYYVNVHTTANPPGEIRGQLVSATPRLGYHSLLTGAEEVPQNDSAALGFATYNLSADLSTLDYHLAVQAIDGVTAAHLHLGWPGQNGPVAHPLYLGGPPPLDDDSPVNGLLALDAQDVLDLWSGIYYTNVHTAANPPGEIRGQVGGATVFGADLSGQNEVPPNGSTGTGRGVFALSDDGSMIHGRVMVKDIEHITAAHIHKAPAGANGPVVIPLFTGGPPPFDEDNPVAGAAPVSDADVFDLLAGRWYINVHTSHLPAGEIRGQLWRQWVPEHFRADLEGDQEVPPVTTDATGHGHFTLDGGQNVLHYFVEIADIDNVSASHIHKGPVGVNGPVVFPLYPNGGAFDPDTPIGGGVTLNGEQLVDLLTAYYYVNVHTTDYPAGEIRGQIMAEPVRVYLPVSAGG